MRKMEPALRLHENVLKWKIKKSIQISRLRKYVETYEMKINQLQEQIVSKERQLEQNVSLIKLYGFYQAKWWIATRPVRIARESGLSGLMRLYQLYDWLPFFTFQRKYIFYHLVSRSTLRPFEHLSESEGESPRPPVRAWKLVRVIMMTFFWEYINP